jgi:hypothetical protein
LDGLLQTNPNLLTSRHPIVSEERAPKSGLPDFGTTKCRNRQQPISIGSEPGIQKRFAILMDSGFRLTPAPE